MVGERLGWRRFMTLYCPLRRRSPLRRIPPDRGALSSPATIHSGRPRDFTAPVAVAVVVQCGPIGSRAAREGVMGLILAWHPLNESPTQKGGTDPSGEKSRRIAPAAPTPDPPARLDESERRRMSLTRQ